MKIVLEGTSDEVGRMLGALAGTYSFETFQAQNEGRTVPVAAVAAQAAPAEGPPKFERLIHVWAEGFDPTGKAHWESNDPINPDKADSLREVAISRESGKVLKWVEAQGGLTHAVHHVLDGDKKISRLIAVNMTQVASILFHDLALLLEHFDPFEEK